MRTAVFLGPTLARHRARGILDADYLPPAQQGDVLRLLAGDGGGMGGVDAIGIVDGYFDLVPSVGHKEILYALSQGVRVFGAASMGALRAAELHAFGMVGVGEVFERFRTGSLEDDDEVAVTHGPQDVGYRPLSVAMVDIRDACDRAAAAGVVPPGVAAEVVARAKRSHYPDRSWPAVLAAAAEVGGPGAGGRLRRFLGAGAPWAKERDARRLLASLAGVVEQPQRQPEPASPPFAFVATRFFEELQAEVAAGTGGFDGAGPAPRR